jgi:hypothetical protein
MVAPMPRPRPRRRHPPDASLPDIEPLEPVDEDAPPRADDLRTVRLVPRPDPGTVSGAPAGTLSSGEPAPPAHPRQVSIDEARVARDLAERVYRRTRQDLERATAETQRAGRRAVAAEERVEKLRRSLVAAEERAHEARKEVDARNDEAAELATELKHVYDALDEARQRVRELESPRATS